jgi:lipopolysaccharide transport system ATP-binding protein
MSDVVLKVDDLAKQYRLGRVSSGMLSQDLKRWWHLMRGKEDPFLRVGETNDRTQKSDNDYVWALQNISFEVNRGDVLAIIGKNGAGKSTLLKILSHVTGPTRGNIHIKGRVGSLLEVGTGMHPDLTGRENIFLNGAILGMRRREIQAKFDDIVDFSGCARYIDTPVKRYSSGMMVRLGFAVAAFLEPEILIVDEVLAVGDAEFQYQAIGKMKDVSESEGRTVLFVSHNMTAVQNLCTRGIILKNGTISYTGNTLDCIAEYRDSNYQESVGIPIAQRTDVKKSGVIHVNDLWMEDHAGEKKMAFLAGEDVHIRFRYESAVEDHEHLSIAFGLYESSGAQIADIWNIAAAGMRDLYPSSADVTCSLPHLPLNAGRYYINICIRLKNTTVYYLKNAAYFDIYQSDFYNSGYMPSQSAGKVLLDQRWEFNTLKA